VSIFIPRWEKYRDKKPSGLYEINESNELSVGLVNHVTALENGIYDAVNGKIVSTEGLAGYYETSSDSGESALGMTGAQAINSLAVDFIVQDQSLTEYTAIQAWETNSLVKHVVADMWAGSVLKWVAECTSNYVAGALQDGNNVLLKSGGSVVVGRNDFAQTFSVNDSGRVGIYQSGVAVPSSNLWVAGVVPNIPNLPTQCPIGHNGSDAPLNGKFIRNSFYNRELSADEIAELHDAPYQILKPRRKFFTMSSASLANALVLSNAVAQSNANALSVTQNQQLSAEISHAQAQIDAFDLQQNHTVQFSPAYSSSLALAIAISIGSVHTLILSDAEAASGADGMALTQEHIFALSDSQAGASDTALNIQQQQILQLSDASAAAQVAALAIAQQQLLGFSSAIADSHAALLVTIQGSVIHLSLAPAYASSQADTGLLAQNNTLQLSGTVAASIAQSLALTQDQQLELSGANAQTVADALNALGKGLGLILSPSVHSVSVRRGLHSVTTKRSIHTLH